MSFHQLCIPSTNLDYWSLAEREHELDPFFLEFVKTEIDLEVEYVLYIEIMQ